MTVAASTALDRYFEQRGIARVEPGCALKVPVRFTNPVAEHLATRRAAGMFDFSFMACAEFAGRDSLAFLHRLQTRNLATLAVHRIAYTLLLREDGTVRNDATVWRLDADRYLLFVGRSEDLMHARSLAADFEVSITDRSREYAVIAVQGCQSWAVLHRCFKATSLSELAYYGFLEAEFADIRCLIGRIGYSGEAGYEIVVAPEQAPRLWEALLRAGADLGLAECGFEAADSLRIEAGHLLFLRELELPVTPQELGLSRLVDFSRRRGIGIGVLSQARWQTPKSRMVGLLIDETACPAATVGRTDRGAARLTSSCVSPVYQRRIGIGFVADEDRYPGTRVRIAPGVNARVARLPFYDPAKFLPRGTR